MKQTDARNLFPKHKLVFSAGKLTVFDKNDTQKVDPVAEITRLVNGGSHLLVRSPKGKLMRFAVVRSFASESAVRKALASDKIFASNNSKPVSDTTVKRAYEKVQNEDFDCCIDILADHFGQGVQQDQWPFLTVHAKNNYMYIGTKKPVEDKIEPRGKKPSVAKEYVQAMVGKPAAAEPVPKATKKPAAKKPVAAKPATKKPAGKMTVGQAIFKAMQEAPVPESAPKPVKATKAPKAKGNRAAWSEEDELACQVLMDVIANANNALAHNHNARRQGISIAEYAKRQKRMRRESKLNKPR